MREEIFSPNGTFLLLDHSYLICLDIDFHIGLPASEASTVSRLSLPSTFEKLREIRHDPRILLALGLLRLAGPIGVMHQAEKATDWIKADKKRITFNNPEVHAIEQPAALGITKARSLAKLFALKLEGKILSTEMLEQFHRPQFSTIDVALKAPLSKGRGFMYEQHPFKRNSWLYGHPGLSPVIILSFLL